MIITIAHPVIMKKYLLDKLYLITNITIILQFIITKYMFVCVWTDILIIKNQFAKNVIIHVLLV
jgi:hypothetical protein